MTEKGIKNEKRTVFGRLSAALILTAFTLVIFAGCLISRYDTDRTVSQKENRTLAQKPGLDVIGFVSGKYSQRFDEYFSDTFPFRDEFLDINAKLSGFFSKNGGSGDMVLVEKQDKDDFAGQNID